LRTLIIDPFKKEVREADIEPSLAAFQAVVGGDLEFAVRIDRRDLLYVSDFAKWPERFTIGNVRTYSGCGLVIGATGEGASAPARVSIDALRGVVRFP
jgi:hypothetical protein